jgi:hypothetical protein
VYNNLVITITEEERSDIRNKYLYGKSSELAKEYRVSKVTILSYVKDKSDRLSRMSKKYSR